MDTKELEDRCLWSWLPNSANRMPITLEVNISNINIKISNINNNLDHIPISIYVYQTVHLSFYHLRLLSINLINRLYLYRAGIEGNRSQRTHPLRPQRSRWEMAQRPPLLGCLFSPPHLIGMPSSKWLRVVLRQPRYPLLLPFGFGIVSATDSWSVCQFALQEYPGWFAVVIGCPSSSSLCPVG